MYNIQNRRYIGNKFSLLNFIGEAVKDLEFNSVCDIFAGTGVVGEYFLKQGKNVIFNDSLYANYIFYNAWFSNEEYNDTKIKQYLKLYNNLQWQDNYFSATFSNTYFDYENAKQIGSIREQLEKDKKNLNFREYCILLTSLLYTTDRVANTCGHFEAFLAKKPERQKIELKILNIQKYNNDVKIYNQDANKLIKNIQCDLLYLDPPYNARQYVNFYHILENLAEWKKPDVFGKTLKMEREHKKSDYSKAKAKDVLKDLVTNAKCKYILLSYNNTYQAKSGATINKITYDEIVEILSKVGKVKIFEKDYKFFNTGKTDFNNHLEYLFLVETEK